MESGPIISDEEFIARMRNRLRLRRFVIAGRPSEVDNSLGTMVPKLPSEVENTIVHGWTAGEIRAIDRVEDALTSALESFTTP